MKMNLRQIIIMIAILVAVTLGFVPGIDTATVVHAADASGVCSKCDNIAWKLEGTTLTISKVAGAESGDICYYCSTHWDDYIDTDTIEKIIIKEGITSIGYYGFSGYVGLTEIIIPYGVESIGESAFSNCTSLTNISLPETVTNIGSTAFFNCKKLQSITIPDGVTSVGNSTFEYCGALTSVTIPNSVTSIGGEAFQYCSSLTSVTIPYGVTCIKYGTFDQCTSLTEVIIPNTVTSIESHAFSQCSELIKITIPNGVTHIGERAFYGCFDMLGIKIPKSLTSMDSGAFMYCQSLTEVVIPGSLKNIPEDAFFDCNELAEVVISDGVESIGESAFGGTEKLKKIIIPGSVKSIENEAFYGSQIEDLTISDGVESIGEEAFAYNRIRNLTISDSVTDIGKEAFYYANVESATIPCRFKAAINTIFSRDITITYTHPVAICTANDTKDILTASCGCGEKEYTAVLKAPSKTGYTGKAIVATCTNKIPGFTPVIKYSGDKLTNGKPVVPGTYTATLTYNNSASVSVKYTITAPAAPAKPHKITNVVSGVHVYWPAATGASKYGLWRSENGANGTYKKITNTTATHYTDTDVESGKIYYYKITTIDTVNNVHSAKSASLGITYVATPDVTLRVNRATGIGLGWDKIPGATGYAIYRKPYDGNADWKRVATITNPNTLKWDDTGVKKENGTVYRYTIRALAGSDRKILSGCRSTGRTMVRLTSRTLNSATKTGATSIKCSWGTTTQATGYEVRFMVGDTVYKTYTIGNYKTGTKTFKDLKAGQTYKIQVRTYKKVDGVGSFYSAWSEAKYVKL